MFHARLEAAALDHEAVNHAMEDGVVVMAFFHVFEKVGDGLRRAGGVQLEGDDAVVFDVQFDFGVAHVVSPWGCFTSRGLIR